MSLLLLTGDDSASSPSGGGLSPDEVDNLFAWYNATDSVSGLDDEDPTGDINDLSGRDMHLDTTLTASPLYRTNQTPAGGPAFEFDGFTNSRSRYRQALTTPPVPEFPQAPGSVFIVAKPTGDEVGQTLFALGRSNFGNPPLRAIQIMRLSGDSWLRAFDKDTAAGTVPHNEWSIFEIHAALPSDRFLMRINGEQLHFTTGQPWFSDVAEVTTRRWSIGGNYNGNTSWASPFIGQIAEVIVYDDTSMDQLSEAPFIRAYLADKHGIDVTF